MSVLLVAPTAKAPGLFAGLRLVLALGPLFPAAKIGRMPAARRFCRSSWNSRLHPGELSVHELLTTFGVSAVLGSLSGSSSHWKPRWIPAVVATPWSLKILTAIHLASGATPIEVPPASRPTMTPIVHVPWPFTSIGVVGCWPFGSYQLFDPPRQPAARSG